MKNLKPSGLLKPCLDGREVKFLLSRDEFLGSCFEKLGAPLILSHRNPMQLVMYLGNDFIAAVPLNKEQVSQPGYMGRIKRQLMDENSEVLQTSSFKPEFLVADISPSNKGDKQ